MSTRSLLLSLLLLAPASLAQSSVTASAATPTSAAVTGSAVVQTTMPSGTTSVVGAASGSVAGVNTATLSVASNLPMTPASGVPDAFSIPNLQSITSGMPEQPSVALSSTPAAGASPTGVSNAPSLPTSLPVAANYPALDKTPPTDSAQVQQWLSEIDMSQIPNITATTGVCGTSPQQAADSSRCWWTCGGCTRDTDITSCPTKYDWGLSYDDGPSPYTPVLLDYLNEHDISTTFFVVGSRVISRPQMVQAEYMAGHQIAVHTWAHPPLTTLTNEQIVAELGWSKQVIKETIGVTPLYMRPPYGDIDDRVRAICKLMGLTPIIWTRTNTIDFDTNDWRIPAGQATGPSSLTAFDAILQNASQIDTGFIVLEHDLYQQAVDLALGWVLPSVIQSVNASSPFKLQSIADCIGGGQQNAYAETTTDTSKQSNGSIIVTTVSGSSGATITSGSSAGSQTAGTSSSNSGSTSGAGRSASFQAGVALLSVAIAAAILL